MSPKRILVASLFALAALYALWFRADAHAGASLLVFAAPPLLLAVAALLGAKRASFFAAVLALFWFSHAVMVAWTRRTEIAFAVAALTLSLGIVLAANWPALRARFRDT